MIAFNIKFFSSSKFYFKKGIKYTSYPTPMASACNNMPILIEDSKSGFAILLSIMTFSMVWFKTESYAIRYEKQSYTILS